MAFIQTFGPQIFRTRSSRIIITSKAASLRGQLRGSFQDYEGEGTNCSYYTSAFKEFLVDR